MDAIFGAGAALLGVVIGLGVEAWRESKRRANNEARRLAETVAAFMAAAVTSDDLSWDIWHQKYDPAGYSRPPAGDATPGRLGLAMRELVPKYYEVLLVVPPSLEAPLTNVYEHVKQYAQSAEDSSVDTEEWRRQWREHRSRLIDATRQVAGKPAINSGRLPRQTTT